MVAANASAMRDVKVMIAFSRNGADAKDFSSRSSHH
jgi:hypothetical protein